MKILNLYSGIGGNRKLWGDNHDITAVEWDYSKVEVYNKLFPNDKTVAGNAHSYLIENYTNYDFIWSSPPCPSHSKINNAGTREREYPDMRLYEEIIFLDKWFDGKFCVENVVPYYKPLIQAQQINRHLFWCNFKLGKPDIEEKAQIKYDNDIATLANAYGYDLDIIKESKITNKRKALRNCVEPEIGKYILGRAQDIYHKSNQEQQVLFTDD